MVGCSGPIWPNRGLTVDLARSGVSALNVKNVIAAELLVRGFSDAGNDGQDAIKNQKTIFYFRGPDDLEVVVQVNLVNEVPIRINQDRETWTPEANRTFEDLATTLEARWPGAVVREPASAK